MTIIFGSYVEEIEVELHPKFGPYIFTKWLLRYLEYAYLIRKHYWTRALTHLRMSCRCNLII